MKLFYLSTVLILLNSFYLLSQNNAIEIQSLTERFENHEFDPYAYKRLSNTWNVLTDKYGYPEIPYDSVAKTFGYVFIFELDNISKETIYNRILEHTSMNYDFLSNILDYQDYESGKIILKTRNPIQSKEGKTMFYSYACRFIILENKLKIEIFKMSIDFHYDIFNYGDVVLTNYEQKYPLEDYFPVTSVKDKFWEDRLKQLNSFDENIRNSSLELIRFIKSYQEDYDF